MDSIYVFRPPTMLSDGDSATVMLFHPDRSLPSQTKIIVFFFEEADGKKTNILIVPNSKMQHAYSFIRRRLFVSTWTIRRGLFTAPKPLHPSLSGFLFPTEIAFLDSIVDLLFEPPAPPVVACPFLRWFSKLFEYTFCEYPNELEAEFEENHDDDDDWQWKEGKRILDSQTIPALDYAVRAAKEENSRFFSVDFQPQTTDEVPFWEGLARTPLEIKERRNASTLDVSAEAASYNAVSIVLDVQYPGTSSTIPQYDGLCSQCH